MPGLILILFSFIAPLFAQDTCESAFVRYHSGHLVVSKDGIALVVKEMNVLGWNLEARTIKAMDAEVRALTREKLGVEIGGKEFVAKAQFRFGSWSKAVKEVTGESVWAYTDWAAIDTSAILQELALTGDMNLRALKNSRAREVEAALRRRGISAGAAAFTDALLARASNSWEYVLAKASLSVLHAKHSSNTALEADGLAYLLRALAPDYPQMRSTDFIRFSAEMRAKTAALGTRSISGRAIWGEIAVNFGSRVAALEYAGFDTGSLRNPTDDLREWAPGQVGEFLKYLVRRRVSLSPDKFLPAYWEISQHAIAFFGERVSAYSVWRAAVHEYGGWLEAVKSVSPQSAAAAVVADSHPAIWRSRLPLQSTPALPTVQLTESIDALAKPEPVEEQASTTSPPLPAQLAASPVRLRWTEVLRRSSIAHQYKDLIELLQKYLRENESLSDYKQVLRFVYRSSWSFKGFEDAPLVLQRLDYEFSHTP